MPFYAIAAHYVCHDLKHADGFELVVERDAPPTAKEARSLAYAEACRRINSSFSFADGSPVEITSLTIRERADFKS